MHLCNMLIFTTAGDNFKIFEIYMKSEMVSSKSTLLRKIYIFTKEFSRTDFL